MKDPRVPLIAKVAPFVLLFLIFSPPELELDMIPFLGLLGAILLIWLAFRVAIWLTPDYLVREHLNEIEHEQ
jgi:hypothetical protein